MAQMEDLAPSSATATIDSFWEIGNYKRTVQRIEDGQRLAGDLMALLQDRAEVEKHYAKSLIGWSKKWNEAIGKGPEYGTMKSTWASVFDATNRMSNVFLDTVKSNLDIVQNSIKQWKSENYHLKMMSLSKEAKVLDDEFRKAQKPWAKLYLKVMKLKKDYHQACKLALTAQNLENNARNDSNISADAKKKVDDKLGKCIKDRDSAQEKYKASIDELTANNPKYLEEMSFTFSKCQNLEKARLEFFKDIFKRIHNSLNLAHIDEISETYNDLEQKINCANEDNDLQWWSDNHGVDMPMYWPTFEEYSPDMHSISRKKGASAMGSDGITLTSLKKDNSHSITRETSIPTSKVSSQHASYHSQDSLLASKRSVSSYNTSKNPFFDNDSEEETVSLSHSPDLERSMDGNPFVAEEETGSNDWNNYDNDTKNAGSIEDEDDIQTEGVPVRAIYDYKGEEGDELSFKTGEIFVKLREKDEQGWCKGRKDGQIGLFPDNYVEFISD